MNSTAKVNDALCFVANIEKILSISMNDTAHSITAKIAANMHVGKINAIYSDASGTSFVCSIISDGTQFNNIPPVCLGTGTSSAAQTSLGTDLSSAISSQFDNICP